MSDLISRSELIKHFEAIQQQENVVGLVFVAAIDEIKEQPTAYDVDKVIEELELHSFELGTDTLPVHYVRLSEAIEIVKQGGVSDASDNVCEWKLEDEEANLYLTGCQQRQLIFEGSPKENGYTYCPYCGKKIKVVE